MGFEKELEMAVNKCSMENGSNTPDFILAEFMSECLTAFNKASRWREKWYGKELKIGGDRVASRQSREIAARVWCDQDMTSVVMDVDAANEIAMIIDRVLENQRQPMETAP